MVLKIPKHFPQPGFYYHYKHDPQKGIRDYAYEVVGLGFHTEEDCRPQDVCMVDYRPLYEESLVRKISLTMGILAVDHRPVDMFMETVVKDGKEILRFQKITDQSLVTQLKTIRDEMYPKAD